MLSLRDVIRIEVTPDEIYDWFLHLETNYRSWHPTHVSCRYVSGRALEGGSVLYAEEYLFGRLNRLKFTLHELEERREFTYRMFPGVRGGFRIQPKDGGTEFLAVIDLGWRVPLVGSLLDSAFELLFSKQIEELRRHMSEEGLNLKAILES